MLKRILSHTFIYGVAQQLPKLAALLSLPIVTKYLTQTDFGVLGVITATVGGISAFANLGLNVIIGNVFYKHPNHYKLAWRQLYGFLIIWNFAYSIMLGVIIYLFIPIEAQDNTWMIIFLNIIPFLVFGPTAVFGRSYYQFKQKPIPIAIRSLIIGLLSVMLNVILISQYHLGYMGWFISIAFSSLVMNISYWIPLNLRLNITPILFFKRRYIKESLRVSFPIIPHYYSNYLLNSSDQLIMKIMNISVDNIGKYNASYMIGNAVQQIGIAAGQAVGPMMLEAYKQKNESRSRLIVFNLQALFLSAVFSLAIWIKEVFHVLLKNEILSDMYVLGIIIVMSYASRPMYIGASSKLFYFEKTKQLLKITLVGGLLNVVLNLMLIPLYGFGVAAVTTYLSLLYMGYSGYFLKDFKAGNALSYYPVYWLILTVILTISAIFIAEFSYYQKVIVNLVTLTSLLFYLNRIKSITK